ncbi:hypothetical protein [Pseudomonas duriflava]|nr:hypothetical protein [Pseudomonas duriflava]
MIASLIVSGAFLLIFISFLNQKLEAHQLEKTRLRAELTSRIRRYEQLSNNLPGQWMSPALKLLLSRLELVLLERLTLKGKSPVDEARIKLLQEEIAKGDEIEIHNAHQTISSEAKAKQVRAQLENLHAQISYAIQNSLIDSREAEYWDGEIRDLMTLLHFEFFDSLGRQFLEQGQLSPARQAFERAAQYIRKKPNADKFEEHLLYLDEQVNAIKIKQGVGQNIREPTQLLQGMEELEKEDAPMKSIYD